MTKPQDFQINLSRGLMEGQVWDDGEAPIEALCIHGWLDNSSSFAPLASELLKKGISSRAVDLWGHGRSPHKTQHESYHYVDWISDLFELVNELYSGEKLHLIGHSLGGSLCMNIAALFPDKVASLTLLDAVGPLIDEGADDFPNRLHDYIFQKRKNRQTRRIFDSLDEAVKRRSFVSDLSEKNAEHIMMRSLIHENDQWILQSDPKLRMISPLRFPKAHALSLLESLDIPTLILLRKDMAETAYYGHYKELVEGKKNVLTHTLDDGHFLHMEKAELCSNEIGTFLKPFIA